MKSTLSYSRWMSLSLLLLLGTALPLKAQLVFSPWGRFMSNNYSNGRSPNGGPPTTGSVQPAISSQGDGVPSIAPAGGTTNGQVVVTGSVVAGYSYDLNATALWSTTGGFMGSFSSTYGPPTSFPAAIGSENGTPVAYVSCGDTNSGGNYGLVALKLNPTKRNGLNYEVLWNSTPSNGTATGVPTTSGSPVVGPTPSGNPPQYPTIYCVDNHSGSTHGNSTSARVYAFQDTASYTLAGKVIPNLKWVYDANSPGWWNQPILYVSGSTTYLVLVGNVQASQGSGSVQLTIRVQVIKDDPSLGPVLVGQFLFPFADGQHGQQAEYGTNGSASLSPDGTHLLIPWTWGLPLSAGSYGTACLSINVAAGTFGGVVWPTINPDVTVAPSGNGVDGTNSFTVQGYSVAIDNLGPPNNVYYVAGDGVTLHKRAIDTGTKASGWPKTLIGTGGNVPALDANDAAIWVASTSGGVGYVQRFPTDGSASTTWNVGDPVKNSVGYLGVAIGTNGATSGTQNNLYFTTTSSTNVIHVRRIR